MSTGSSATVPASTGTSPLEVAAPPVRLTGLPRRRRPFFAAAGVALVAVGAAVAVSLVSAAGGRTAVLVVARPVPVGAVLSAADLSVARVGVDAALRPMAAADRSRAVGRRAAVALNPGALLTAADLTSRPVPAGGQRLVAVALKAGQLPMSGLRAGDRVLVVVTPGDGSASAEAAVAVGPPVSAVVHAQSVPGQDGSVVVDLIAAGSDGVRIAEESSTGRVALVLLPAGG